MNETAGFAPGPSDRDSTVDPEQARQERLQTIAGARNELMGSSSPERQQQVDELSEEALGTLVLLALNKQYEDGQNFSDVSVLRARVVETILPICKDLGIGNPEDIVDKMEWFRPGQAH